MTSPSALQFNTYYHIFNRGTNGENIFLEEQNYPYFLQLYEKHISPIAETCAFCLMKNHFHLAVRIRSEVEIAMDLQNASQTENIKPGIVGMKFSNFFNAYAKSINKKYNRTGSLFEHPFGRIPIHSSRQLWAVIAYIHQNPQKHQFVEDFRDWKYSSYPLLISEKDTFLNKKTVFDCFGSLNTYIAYHDTMVKEVAGKIKVLHDFE